MPTGTGRESDWKLRCGARGTNGNARQECSLKTKFSDRASGFPLSPPEPEQDPAGGAGVDGVDEGPSTPFFLKRESRFKTRGLTEAREVHLSYTGSRVT
jgi:hypothetical protein